MGGAGFAAPALIWSLISPVIFFLAAMGGIFLFCRAPEWTRFHEPARCRQWWV